MNKAVLITRPAINDHGGIANYYNSIKDVLAMSSDLKFIYLEIGSTTGRFLHYISDQAAFNRVIAEYDIKLILLNPSLDFKGFMREGLLILQALKSKIPVIVFFHGWEKKFEKILINYFKWFFNLTYKKAAAIITLDSEVRTKLREWGIIKPIYLETTVVDSRLINNFSIDEKIKSFYKTSKTKVLFMSRLEKEKGIFESIEIISYLRKMGYSIELTIAGQGRILGEVRKLVADKLENRDVNITGYIRGPIKNRVLAENNIFLFPTYYKEGMPICVLEAMAFGLPIITRAVGGINDFFEQGKMGFITESKDISVFSKYIENLLLDKELYEKISRYNHQYANKTFLSPLVAERLNKICMNTLKEA